jgi:hypothetical protein
MTLCGLLHCVNGRQAVQNKSAQSALIRSAQTRAIFQAIETLTFIIPVRWHDACYEDVGRQDAA